MASKDKYKSILERYKQAIIKNPKLNLSAYSRLNGVSVSGMHHYIEDIGQSVKSIRDAVLKATEHQDCEAFVPFTADSPHSDVDRAIGKDEGRRHSGLSDLYEIRLCTGPLQESNLQTPPLHTGRQSV